MKFFISAFAVLVASSAFACPTLGGNYSCVYIGDTNASNWVVTQNGLQYDFNMGEGGGKLSVIADGQVRKVSTTDSMQASCQGDILNVTDFNQAGKYFAQVTIDSALKKMTLKYWQDVPNPSPTGWICTRQ